ncbi:MAG TPA: hypothetical protein VEC37_18745 [Bacillota bacterium]|nr:hypothetical protein [Bacillota bacterium]
MKRGWMALVIIYIILIITQLVLCTRPASAAGVQFTVTMGYGGYVTPGRWNPLRIAVNQAVANGRIVIIRQEQGKTADEIVETFPLQGLQLELSVLANEQNGCLKIQLLSGEQILAEQMIDLTQKVFPGHLVLALNVPATVQQKLTKVLLPEEPVRVATAKLADMGAVFLNYDCVSALVMRDPGAVLAPLQVEAIYSWLTGGGKLILCNVRPGRRSLLSEFSKLRLPQISDGPATIKVGRGEVRLWSEDFTVLNQSISSWQQVLNLQPYERSQRLTASDCFPVLPQPPPRRKPMDTTPRAAITYIGIYLFLGIWAILVTGVTLWGQLRSISYLLGFTLLGVIIAYPVGSLVSEQWQRGIEVYTRAIILPQSGGILWASDIKMADLDIYDAGSHQSSPWGANVTLNDDAGTVRSRNALQTIWKHRIASPRALIREVNPNALNLVGIIQPGPNIGTMDLSSNVGQDRDRNIKNQLAKEIAYWDGKSWWQMQGQYKKPTPHSRIPNWLLEEREWVEKLIELFPDQPWLFRRGVLPELELKIEGSPATKVLFVAPSGGE